MCPDPIFQLDHKVHCGEKKLSVVSNSAQLGLAEALHVCVPGVGAL